MMEMEIGEFKMVEPSITLDGLELENTSLKNSKNTLTAIAVVTVVIGLFVYARYLQVKEQLKKNEIRMLKPEDVE
jgi:hypothetical protein